MMCPMAEEVEDLATFLKMTEEQRRERQRRIDAGDETARLKFSPLALSAAPSAPKTASQAAPAPGAGGAIRPGGPGWSGNPPKQWARPQGGAIYPQTGFKAPGAGGPGAWPGAGGWGG